jgi:hypothetical protein
MSRDHVKALSGALNFRQNAFARKLGIAMAEGIRNYERAYQAAGYRPNRGNARRTVASGARPLALIERPRDLRQAPARIASGELE